MDIMHENLLGAISDKAHHDKRSFIKDGIIDEKKWIASPLRILFILKEAYDKDGDGYDLRHTIREEWRGPKHKMWRLAGSLASALTQISCGFNPYFEDDNTAEVAAKEALLSSAIVNLKKSNGKSSSRLDDVKHFAEIDADEISKQITIINPKVIICGNTWSIVEEFIIKDATRIHEMVWKTESKIIFDIWHPANRYPNQLNYWALVGVALNSGVIGSNLTS